MEENTQKTTDGFELKLFGHYYSENGESLILNEFATDSKGKTVFMVTPIFEGESMTVSGDGGHHNEYTCDYEHEGVEIFVESIFEKAPLNKLDATYKQKQQDITNIGIAVGKLSSLKKALNLEINSLNGSLKKMHDEIVRRIEDRATKKNSLEELNSKISDKKQILSDLEDAIPDIKTDSDSVYINKKELQSLNKTAFMMQCLQSGGVDNWEWFDESTKGFREKYPG